MRRKYIVPAIAALLISGAVSCRTNEKNYKAAYEKTLEKQKEGLDETIYTKIRREAQPQTVEFEGKTIGMKGELVKLTAGLAPADARLMKYNVVVGQFKQLFHAKSMQRRFADAGFDGTLVVETREPLYYVVAVSTDNLSEAVAALESLRASAPMKLREECPWILNAASTR